MPKTPQTAKTATPKPTQTVMLQVPQAAAQPAPPRSERPPFVPYNTEQKKEYAKQFSPEQIASYHKGRQSAYQHSANMANREAKFIRENKDN
ncbi:MAG: hypothetical protein FWC00_03605 [Firmicutes bacterium]|nr:hypothetical protein [Bacillota bacterium]